MGGNRGPKGGRGGEGRLRGRGANQIGRVHLKEGKSKRVQTRFQSRIKVEQGGTTLKKYA